MPRPKLSKSAEAELARLTEEQAFDDRTLQAGTAPRLTKTEGFSGTALSNEGKRVQREHRSLADVGRRDMPKDGRRPKVAKGTNRHVFGSVVVHALGYTTASGVVDVEGRPLLPPKTWAEAAARMITGAKSSVKAYLDRIRAVPEEQRRGVPDPRGPARLGSGETLSVSTAGLSIRKGHGGSYYGRGEAHPDRIVMQLRADGFAPPTWLSAELLNWLVDMASGGPSGGRGSALKGRGRGAAAAGGSLSTSTLARLLRNPRALSAELMRRAGNNLALKKIAASLPRKPRTRRP